MNLDLGVLTATPGAIEALSSNGMRSWLAESAQYLRRHMRGDWGDVPPEDARENDLSVEEGFRVLSSYTLESGDRIWIITEADRSSTTILLPSEY